MFFCLHGSCWVPAIAVASSLTFFGRWWYWGKCPGSSVKSCFLWVWLGWSTNAFICELEKCVHSSKCHLCVRSYHDSNDLNKRGRRMKCWWDSLSLSSSHAIPLATELHIHTSHSSSDWIMDCTYCHWLQRASYGESVHNQYIQYTYFVFARRLCLCV